VGLKKRKGRPFPSTPSVAPSHVLRTEQASRPSLAGLAVGAVSRKVCAPVRFAAGKKAPSGRLGYPRNTNQLPQGEIRK